MCFERKGGGGRGVLTCKQSLRRSLLPLNSNYLLTTGQATGMVVDVDGGRAKAGTQVILWPSRYNEDGSARRNQVGIADGKDVRLDMLS